MKKISILLVLVLLASVFTMSASAESRASNLIIDYSGTIGETSAGDIMVAFDITTLGDANSLGATRVEVQRKESGVWRNAAVFTLATDSDMLFQNRSGYRSTVTYEDPDSGYEYRAYIKFYASNGTFTESRDYYTNSIRV